MKLITQFVECFVHIYSKVDIFFTIAGFRVQLNRQIRTKSTQNAIHARGVSVHMCLFCMKNPTLCDPFRNCVLPRALLRAHRMLETGGK